MNKAIRAGRRGEPRLGGVGKGQGVLALVHDLAVAGEGEPVGAGEGPSRVVSSVRWTAVKPGA
ncbi:hypothetical protein ACF07T_41340 [Streptomyces sp. NPDC015184]|uniref:hypothetical protein n=1 Tax=Streptomyces sp. NPDC015184 TaxID=3364946 RepID=UPI0036FEC9B3